MKTLAHLLASTAIAAMLCFLSPLLSAPFTRFAWTVLDTQALAVLTTATLLLRVVLRRWLQPTTMLRGIAILQDAALAYIIGLGLFCILSWLLRH